MSKITHYVAKLIVQLSFLRSFTAYQCKAKNYIKYLLSLHDSFTQISNLQISQRIELNH